MVEAEGKHCFTYCGHDKCTCPAREFESVLSWVGTSLPVLETVCTKVGLVLGAEKAAEMKAEVRRTLLAKAGKQGEGDREG